MTLVDWKTMPSHKKFSVDYQFYVVAATTFQTTKKKNEEIISKNFPQNRQI